MQATCATCAHFYEDTGVCLERSRGYGPTTAEQSCEKHVSEDAKPDFHFIGTGERKPNLDRLGLLQSISEMEEFLCGTDDQAAWQEATRKAGLAWFWGLYGYRGNDPFGPDGDTFETWTDLQVYNWHHYIESLYANGSPVLLTPASGLPQSTAVPMSWHSRDA